MCARKDKTIIGIDTVVPIDHYPVYIIMLRRRNDHYNLSCYHLRFDYVTVVAVVAVVMAAESVAVVAMVAV